MPRKRLCRFYVEFMLSGAKAPLNHTHLVSTVDELPRMHTALMGFQVCIRATARPSPEALGSFIAHLLFTPKSELHIYREIVVHRMSW